ncbi:HAMP domain-containing sensor histidine kinase [Burkholderia sp. Ac-20379]|uniref:HAMP domain-containing sensor histidine kinase n=1 Tax=Burkholderia sp. Ac-20379 TaxID=2703900 RepID=UPI0030D881DB
MRITLGLTLLFLVSWMFLLGVVGVAATSIIESDADTILRWQLIYFDAVPDAALPAAMVGRVEHAQVRANVYGLFDRTDQPLAGELRVMPDGLADDRRGRTLHGTLRIGDTLLNGSVRAMAARRPDGDRLVIVRDMSDSLQVRDSIGRVLLACGLLCLVVCLATGGFMAWRQGRRIGAIREVTERIADGEISRRLPVNGGDEIHMLSRLVNQMLAEVERLMGEMQVACDGIAHDLRMPLSRLRTLLGQAAGHPDLAQIPELQKLLARTGDEADSLIQRFRAMLRISEMNASQRRLGFSRVNLRELVEELGELYAPLADSEGCALEIAASTDVFVQADRELIFEALSNLLDNAIKFTRSGGRVALALHDSANGARVEVSDDGPGIPEAEREVVLARHYRGHASRTTAGYGLGLSVVAAVVRLHGFGLRLDDAQPGLRATILCRESA